MTNDMNSAYLSPTLPVNLFSLGQMQRSRATYSPDPLRPLTHVFISSSPSGSLLAHATLSTHNLLPVNFNALHVASLLSSTAFHPSAFTATFLTPHINAEKRSRADAAEELHTDLCHPSDRSLCVNLPTGKLPFSTLTSSDVTLNRHLRGPCPHCAAGKHRNPPYPPSTTAPANSIGAVLSYDPQLLPEPFPGLHTHEIILAFCAHLLRDAVQMQADESQTRANVVFTLNTYRSNAQFLDQIVFHDAFSAIIDNIKPMPSAPQSYALQTSPITTSYPRMSAINREHLLSETTDHTEENDDDNDDDDDDEYSDHESEGDDIDMTPPGSSSDDHRRYNYPRRPHPI